MSLHSPRQAQHPLCDRVQGGLLLRPHQELVEGALEDLEFLVLALDRAQEPLQR